MGARALRLRQQLGGAGAQQPLGHRAAQRRPASVASCSSTSRIQWLPSGRPT